MEVSITIDCSRYKNFHKNESIPEGDHLRLVFIKILTSDAQVYSSSNVYPDILNTGPLPIVRVNLNSDELCTEGFCQLI